MSLHVALPQPVADLHQPVLVRDHQPVEPQLAVADMEAEADIFAELAQMQQTGIFGMRGPLRSAWTFTADYPLATLAVDNDILEERWELTHPALAQEEEEFRW